MNTFEKLYESLRQAERFQYAPQKFYEWWLDNKRGKIEDYKGAHAKDMALFRSVDEATLRGWIFEFLLEDT